MGTYSFLDVTAAIAGPGGNINIGSGAGSAEEGITVEAHEDKNIMKLGADGAGIHSLVAGEASKVTIRLLKTSPVNALLSQMYNFQTLSSANWGNNVITIRDIARGDRVVLAQAAFAKRPPNDFAKEGKNIDWTFDAITTEVILGNGQPEA